MSGTINRAIGQAEAAIGSAVGSEDLKSRGEQNIRQADIDSHTTGSATAAGITGNTSGGFAAQDPHRTKGAYNEKVGDMKQNLGSLVGSDSLAQSGHEQHAKGTGQEATGKIKDTAQGLGEHAQGKLGGAAAYMTGNTVKEREFDQEAADGKARLQNVTKQ